MKKSAITRALRRASRVLTDDEVAVEKRRIERERKKHAPRRPKAKWLDARGRPIPIVGTGGSDSVRTVSGGLPSLGRRR